MKKTTFATIVFSSIAILAFSGCASKENQFLKNETAQSIQGKIKDGVTTKDEVSALFGLAQNISFTDGGKEIWTYRLDDVFADAINFVPVIGWFGSSYSGHATSLVIIYENDIVLKHSFGKSKVNTKTGVFK